MKGAELAAYTKGYHDGASWNVKYPQMLMIAGYKLEQVVALVFKDQEEKAMAKNLKYQWCEPTGTTDKEFIGWIYERLHSVFGERMSLDYMQRLSKFVDSMPGVIPDKMSKALEANPVLAAKREAFREELDRLGHPEATQFSHWALEAFDRAHELRD